MFCTVCATHNPSSLPRCSRCGAEFASSAGPREPRAGKAASPPVQTPRRRLGLFHRVLYVVPAVALLLAGTQFLNGARAQQRELAAAYERAETAAAEGRYLDAIDDYVAAAGYRDALDRRADVSAMLAPYHDAYLQGLAALEEGRYDAAIASLLSIVRDLPEYEDAAMLLEAARADREAELLPRADEAMQTDDWWMAEQAYAELVAGSGGDPALTARLAEIRRDHAPMVFTRGRELYLVGPDGEDEQLLTNEVAAAWPVWSPDRSQIAFIAAEDAWVAGGSRLYVIQGDGSGLTEVANEVRTEGWPVWSPDGTKIAFIGGVESTTSASASTRSIRYVDLPTGRVTDLTGDQIANPTSPSWSPNGDRLAFVSRRSFDRAGDSPRYPSGAIYVATIANGSISMAIGEGVNFDDARRLSWSPSRELLLVFSRTDGSPSDRESIAMVDLDRGTWTRVYGSSMDVSTPVWSPDGLRFAFIVDETTVHVQTPGALDDRPRTIYLGERVGRSVIWSPDGASVLVIASRGGEASVLAPIGGDWDERRPLTLSFDIDRRLGGAPQWAPLSRAAGDDARSYGGTAGDPASP